LKNSGSGSKPKVFIDNGPYPKWIKSSLGVQAGEARLRQVFMEAGFTRFRRATATPFNLILEARK
jgi:hypothetical protein